MNTLWKWIKFFLTKEPNPIKTEHYFATILWFRADIQQAKRSGDWPKYGQYLGIFAFLAAIIVYFFYLYQTNLNKFDSYIMLEIHGWVNNLKQMNLITCLFYILVAYYLHSLYFSPDFNYFMKWQYDLILMKKRRRYHWPHHYRGNECGPLIRKAFMQIFNSLQVTTVTAGLSNGFRFII